MKIYGILDKGTNLVIAYKLGNKRSNLYDYSQSTTASSITFDKNNNISVSLGMEKVLVDSKKIDLIIEE